MIINDVFINAELSDILTELQRQLHTNQIPYLHSVVDSGNNIMVTCPYHGNGQERRPSAGIRKSDGTFHCFACGEVHSLTEVIGYCFGHNDVLGKFGLSWLMNNFGTVRREERKDVEIDMGRSNITNKDNVLDSSAHSKSDSFVSEEELDSYRYYHSYWATRGIVDDDIIELFDLGYDVDTVCITFPVRDINGNCLFVARRSVHGKRFNYPKGVDKPLYGLYELHKCLQDLGTPFDYGIGNKIKVYLTESMIDCILLWQSGNYALALNGTGSELQFKQLSQLPCRHIVLATDNDTAGQKARDKIRKNVPNKLITEIEFPSDIKDIGDLGKAQRFDALCNIERWEVF